MIIPVRIAVSVMSLSIINVPFFEDVLTDKMHSWNDSTDDDSDYQTSLCHSRRMTPYSSDRGGGFGSSSVSESFLSPPRVMLMAVMVRESLFSHSHRAAAVAV